MFSFQLDWAVERKYAKRKKFSVNQLWKVTQGKYVQGGAWDLVTNGKDIWGDVKNIEKPGPES